MLGVTDQRLDWRFEDVEDVAGLASQIRERGGRPAALWLPRAAPDLVAANLASWTF